MQKTGPLTAALEDYLEAIFNLCRHDKAARSRDIAESLNVHKSTVTAALKSLANMELINYSPYEAVTLTPEGRKIAADVAGRHRALQDFFVNVLKVDPALAEEAACGMEHSVPREIVEKLADFAVSMRGCPRLEPAPEKRENCGVCLEGENAPEGQGTLASAPVGKTVLVASLRGSSRLRKRLSELGLARGAGVTVERVAPLGDPLELRVRGMRFSLRREDAAGVLIQENSEDA